MESNILISSNNLSEAWIQAMQAIIDSSGKELTPLLITLTNFEENDNVKKILSDSLIDAGFGSIDTVSETIFPSSLYRYLKGDRHKLYSEYLTNVLPRIKKIEKQNRNGTYFERMISFGEGNKNQLEIVINSLNQQNVKRRSKLQIAIFNPMTDHKESVFQGFPCLQHVTFYKSENNGLVINAFYAIQYLYKRAYGNWLGIINLGKFVAEQSGLNLERLNCFIGVEQLDHLKKTEARNLLAKISFNNEY
ncbi:MAG: hypothetical protein BGO86_02755 [Chryseobacterium sp. 36-9]|nr:MAG: hypothetical protein BGO86_02755 [Chryseobacterium sp. 36-9]